MKRATLLCVLGLFLIGSLSTQVKSQSADDIMEKMIEAMGGRKTLEKIKDTTISGSMDLTQMGLDGAITVYQKEPNKSRFDIEVMGMVITQACDGETAWMINPQTGMTEEMPEQAAEYMKRESLGNSVYLDPKKFGITFTFKGKENIEGKDYLVLEQAYADGFTSTMFIDPDTYLVFKQREIVIAAPTGETDPGYEIVMSTDPDLLGETDLAGRVKITMTIERLPFTKEDLAMFNDLSRGIPEAKG